VSDSGTASQVLREKRVPYQKGKTSYDSGRSEPAKKEREGERARLPSIQKVVCAMTNAEKRYIQNRGGSIKSFVKRPLLGRCLGVLPFNVPGENPREGKRRGHRLDVEEEKKFERVRGKGDLIDRTWRGEPFVLEGKASRRPGGKKK